MPRLSFIVIEESVTAKGDKILPLARAVDRAEWAAWSQCVEDLGTERFAQRLLHAISLGTGAEHLAFYSFQDTLKPILIAAVSSTEDAIAATSAQIYQEADYYQYDPHSRQLADGPHSGEEPSDGEPLIFFVAAEDIGDAQYRQEIYERYDLDGRLSLLDRSDGSWHAIGIFKHRSTGGFEQADFNAFADCATLISKLAAGHLARLDGEQWQHATRPPLSYLEDLLRQVGPALSERERQVCSRALQGVTGEGIALDLHISENTVATLRKRAYAKLGVTTLNELFALCLVAVTRR